jgi:hypothetical protein
MGGILGSEVDKIFPYRVGGSLVPPGVFKGLFRRQNLHEASGKGIEKIGPSDMEVQGSGVKLG